MGAMKTPLTLKILSEWRGITRSECSRIRYGSYDFRIYLSHEGLIDLMRDHNSYLKETHQVGFPSAVYGMLITRTPDDLEEIVAIDNGHKIWSSTLIRLEWFGTERPKPGYLIRQVDLRNSNPKAGASPLRILR